MKVVANSGPLIALGKLGLLDLLHRLYGQVYIPSAVYTEVVVRGSEYGYPDAYVVKLAIQREHLAVVTIEDNELPNEISSLPLGIGEKQSLYLPFVIKPILYYLTIPKRARKLLHGD